MYMCVVLCLFGVSMVSNMMCSTYTSVARATDSTVQRTLTQAQLST